MIHGTWILSVREKILGPWSWNCPIPFQSETQNAIITYESKDYWPPDKLKHVNTSLKWVMYTRQSSYPSTAIYNKH